jgi:hypothetical protein
MPAWYKHKFLAVCHAVRKYQRQIVPMVSPESTFVPWAGIDELSTMLAHRFFARGA